MLLELQRDPRPQNQIPGSSVPGLLKVDGLFECFSLERKGVEIPTGDYSIELTYSPHFGRDLPLVDNVPGRSAIRIHPGNKPEDSEGCILVGSSRANDGMVEGSRIACDSLIAKIKAAIDSGDSVTISVLQA